MTWIYWGTPPSPCLTPTQQCANPKPQLMHSKTNPTVQHCKPAQYCCSICDHVLWWSVCSGCSRTALHWWTGGRAEGRAQRWIWMRRAQAGPPSSPSSPSLSVLSRILFYTGCCVSASVRTVSQSNGFVALNDWQQQQQQQQQRLSDVGDAVGRLLLRLFPLCLLAAHWQFVSFSLFYSDKKWIG